ncbi:hypothetical protein ABH935_001896 [Catenulispora sp. GAS73]|uniref:hypothetical protein n=1 Tax=Catenulispora sp. GAS73 TaxID=3156269 RepID=UPI0035122054
MFSVNEYVKRRYADAEDKPTEVVIQRVQALVDASGLAEHDALVETLLDGLTAPEYSAVMDLPEIRTWLQRTATLRGLGTPWETALTDYARGLSADTGLEVTEFYKHCLSTGVLPFLAAESGAIARTLPLILISPAVTTKQTGTGFRRSVRYSNKEEITIGAGLLEVVAGFRAPAGQKGQPRVGVLQFVTSDRTAKFNDGTTVRRSFQHALDSEQRPWLKDVSVQLAPDSPTVLTVNDAPKWDLPVEDDQKRELVSVAINDRFTTHVVTQTGPNTFSTFYTCDWTFTAAYATANHQTATQSYTVISKGPSNTQIRLTGQELLANEQPDLVTE